MSTPLLTKKGTPRIPPKRRNDIVDIMPCFFDLQVHVVINVLNISSHTMMRIRKDMALDRWPFEKIRFGKTFKWRGQTFGWEDIQAFRTATIPTVSEEMQGILRMCDRKGVLMRAMFLPGYSSVLQGASKSQVIEGAKSQVIEAFIEGVKTDKEARIEAFIEGAKTDKEARMEKESNRQLLEEIGLFDFNESFPDVTLESWTDIQPVVLEPDGYWPAAMDEPTVEEEAYWADVSRLLLECEPL
jgi:hypothetical protein